MSPDDPKGKLRYQPPAPAAGCQPWFLIEAAGESAERRFAFYDHLEIGRDDGQTAVSPAQLLVSDPTVSRQHCVLRQSPDGRCFVRDVSRNGTRLDGRRMVPNVEVEIRPGQVLAIGGLVQLLIEGGPQEPLADGPAPAGATVGAPGSSIATVLVGDIRDYTVLVRRAPSVELQQSVNRVFERLDQAVTECGGTVKEYQGDAILAFWEGNLSGTQAVAACRAALKLDRIVRELAEDATVWQLSDFPLRIDFALATGPVLLDSFGGAQRAGLSLIGEPVVLAFRLEKFATDETGPILACRATQAMASGQFRFRHLGSMRAKGFDQADDVFSLLGEQSGE